MTRDTPIQTALNGGELSNRMMGRIDTTIYRAGAEEMIGYLPVVQGPAIAAPGTHFVEYAKASCRLIPFQFNVTQGYVIEASASTFRFYTNNVRIESPPGTPYEVATSYLAAELAGIDYEQSEDVLYLTHSSHAPMKLERLTATSFDLVAIDFQNGPFDDQNIDQTLTVTADAVDLGDTGTLTASAALFDAGDVGGLMRIETEDLSAIPAWEPGLDITIGEYRTWDGRVYQCTATVGKTGTVAPIHDSGTEWDGSSSGQDVNGNGPFGAQWLYVHDRYGVVKITGFTDSTHVAMTVTRRLPWNSALTAEATWRWNFGSFSAKRGWPKCVKICNERLTFSKNATIYASVVGDYENFAELDSSGEQTADQAIRITLPNPDEIQWLQADKELLIGTARAEHVMRAASTASALGPKNVKIDTQSTFGSAPVRPIAASGRVLFVQKARRKLMEISYDVEQDRNAAIDITRFADHIGASKFQEIAFAQEPDRHIWAVDGAGELRCCCYEPADQVLGWARRPLADGLAATSICTITDPDGDFDQLWIAASYGGQTMVLLMAPLWRQGDAKEDAFFVDAGLSYAGSPVGTVGGLDHLIGAEVDILVDGASHPRRTVAADGTVTLDAPASKIHVGLPYTSRIKTLRPETRSTDGASQGKIKRINRITLRLADALGIQVTAQDCDPEFLENRLADVPMGQGPDLFSGDYVFEAIGGYDTDGQLVIERVFPQPSTITAIMPTYVTGDR